MNDLKLDSWKCTYCNLYFSSFRAQCGHVQYSCPNKNIASQVSSTKGAKAKGAKPIGPGTNNNSTHNVILNKKQLEEDRAMTHDEALGYNNTVLLNAESLSRKTKSAIKESKRLNKKFEEYESDSDDSILSDSGDDVHTTLNDFADNLDESSTQDEPDSDEEFLPAQQLDDDLSDSDSEVEGDPWVAWKVKKNAKEKPGEQRSSFFSPQDGIKGDDVSPLNVALIDLLWRLDHHHVDLNVFDEIVEWAIFFSKKYPKLFRLIGKADPTTRKTFLKQLRKLFDSDDLSPKVTDIKLDSGRLVTMPIWSFKHVVADMLQDENLMRSENFCKENFDPRSWGPVVPVEEFLQSNHERISLQEEVAQEVEELKKSVLPCPMSKEALLGKTIEVLCENYVQDGDERTHTSYQWFVGTIAEVTSIDKINGTDVKIDWPRTATSRKSRRMWRLDYNLWCQDELHSWRYPSTECNNRDEEKESPWKATKKAMDKELSSLPIADVYTGTMLTMGVSRFVKGLKPHGIQRVRALPIILFIDKSHTDLFGSLATTPLSYTLGVFNHICRRQVEYWRNQAYIPPLHVGKGKNAGKLDLDAYVNDIERRKQGHGPKPIASVEKLKDHHKLLREALKPLDHACKTGIIVEHKDGSVIMYQPFILLSIGDTAGNNELCCHHNNSGNSKSACLCYTCQCSFDNLVVTPVECKPITVEDINQSLVDKDYAKSISQHQVRSAFHDMALADKNGGIMSLMPREWLHVFPQGLFMGSTKVIHNLIGTKDKNARFKDHFNMLHQRIATALHRNSDRDLPRTASRGAYFDMSCCYGTEKEGNLYCANVCFHTFQGKGIMKPFLDRVDIPMSKFCYTIQLLLSYSAWIHEHKISRWEVMHALPVVEELMECMLNYLPNKVVRKKRAKANTKASEVLPTKAKATGKPSTKANTKATEVLPTKTNATGKPSTKKRQRSTSNSGDGEPVPILTSEEKDELDPDLEGSNGWHTPKFHSMSQFIDSMQKFGTATNFDSSHGEGHHKEFVKKPGKNTNRRVDGFTGQVGLRYDESQLIKRAHFKVAHRCPRRKFVHTYGSTQRDHIELRGKYALEIEKVVARGRSNIQYNFKHVWSDYKKTLNKDQFMLDILLKQALGNCASADDFNTDISVIGYTEVTFPVDDTELSGVTFRASPNYRGFQWYDWALVKFPASGASRDQSDDDLCHRPARVIGFVQYFTPGYPTYNLCKRDNYTPRHVRDHALTDHDTYVVLDCANEGISKRDLDGNFITPFELEPNDSGLRILPLNVIVEPMVVVTNFRAETKVHYLACLPKRKWGNLFRRRIKEIYDGRIDSTDQKNERWWNNRELFKDVEIEDTSDDDDTSDAEEELHRDGEDC